MENEIKRIVNIIKEQAETFLLMANEFYPFGAYINKKNSIIPLGAYLENDQPPSLEVMTLLEKAIVDHIQKGDCILGAIAIDVYVSFNDKKHDAIEIRFFEAGKDTYKRHYKYEITDKQVQFLDD